MSTFCVGTYFKLTLPSAMSRSQLTFTHTFDHVVMLSLSRPEWPPRRGGVASGAGLGGIGSETPNLNPTGLKSYRINQRGHV